jgi:Tfp pilus assembly protein PilV
MSLFRVSKDGSGLRQADLIVDGVIMRSFNRDTEGCTLVELSIALVVFLIGLIALLQLLIVALDVNQRSRDTILATTLAQAKADELLRLGFSAPELNRGGVIPTDPENSPFAGLNPSPLQCYTDYFTYDGSYISGPVTPCTSGTAIASAPTITYFARQWQIQVCDTTCGSAQNRCTDTCASGNLKKITVTVTALSPLFRGQPASATVVVYSSNLN